MVITEIIYGLRSRESWSNEQTFEVLDTLVKNKWVYSVVGISDYQASNSEHSYLNPSQDDAIDLYPESMPETYRYLNVMKSDYFSVLCSCIELNLINDVWIQFCKEATLDQNFIHSISIYVGRFMFRDAYSEDRDPIEVDSVAIVLSVDGNYPEDLITESRLQGISKSLNEMLDSDFQFLGSVQG